MTWTPGLAPVHVVLTDPAPEQPTSTPNLPPLNGEYISPDTWHQLYANGIIISNASHDRFTQNQPPPPPGGSQTHSFGSMVTFDIFQGGQPPLHVTAPAAVQTAVSSTQDSGDTRYFDTEMLSLNISGGSLPAGVMVRESPTRQSLGKTSVRQVPADGTYRIGSFFDIFTEISTDGGATWFPAVSGPVSVHLNIPTTVLGITCPLPVYLTSAVPVAVTYPAPTIVGGCPPVNVVCNPPSGSTFPIGITVVNCTATDSCGTNVQCSFEVIVRSGDPCTDPGTNGTVTLPPTGCQYLSPDQVHMIIDGLPPGTTIQLAAIHKDFICHQSGGPPVCTNDCFTVDDCDVTNGATEQFDSTVQLQLTGTGLLNGWVRNITIPNVSCQSQVGPRTPGNPVQSFDTVMQAIQGQITGDPDFDLLRVTGGTAFGMPSPGHTTLTRQGPPGSNWAVDSFFDITYRIDFVGAPGGALAGRSGSTTATIRMGAVPATNNAPVTITCPDNLTTTAVTPAGTVVNYLAPVVAGGCAPVSVVCNPPSGSTFPVGVTIVTCVASDACGQSAICSFSVTVRPPPPEIFFKDNGLPPTNGMYISPALFHQLYAAGIIIRDIKHARFTGNLPPPPPGPGQDHSFGSVVEMEVSMDGGLSYTKHSAPAAVTTHVTRQGATQTFDTEMLQLSIQGGTLPASIRLRESPTKASLGRTTVQPIGGGNLISSFFDVFTELSTDGGATWMPAADSTHVELRKDPTIAPPQELPNNRLPPRQGAYVSPAQWHQAYANGIVISNISHARFTDNLPAPPAGSSQVHTFNSHLDVMFSQDGGANYQPVRVDAAVTVELQSRSSSDGTGIFDTEMLQLDVTGGLPAGVMLRESPTRRSLGQVQMQQNPDGTFRVHSFFDIFTDISLDGGVLWHPATNGPGHVQLRQTPEKTFPTPTLPPQQGQYVSPAQWHAAFANGIIISNVSHQRFLESFPPPPPGGSNVHTFGSTVQMQLSLNGGSSFSPASAPAGVGVSVASIAIEDGTRFFDTEMLQLSLSGGGLPPGVMIRESPTRRSTGGTAMRQPAGSTSFRISSFFDIFLESSLDGGATWSPSVSGPSHVSLDNLVANPCVGPASLTITRSPDGTSVTITWTGTGFHLQSTTALTGPTTTVWTDVPGTSGVTLPVEPGVNKFYRVTCP
ncbi:MAG TPA: HYR domain-containing protein [Vicinamibacterales bacterium]|nr:HYR domain-containing protein [Vicinamibacterales bacterium]